MLRVRKLDWGVFPLVMEPRTKWDGPNNFISSLPIADLEVQRVLRLKWQSNTRWKIKLCACVYCRPRARAHTRFFIHRLSKLLCSLVETRLISQLWNSLFVHVYVLIWFNLLGSSTLTSTTRLFWLQQSQNAEDTVFFKAVCIVCVCASIGIRDHLSCNVYTQQLLI